MLLTEYMEANGLSEQDIADALGKNVRGIRGMKNREIPRSWAQQLGVPFDEQAAAVERDRYVQKTTRDADEEGAPVAPAGAKVEAQPQPAATAPVSDPNTARERIAGLYGLVGQGMASRTGNPGFAVVVDDQAPRIADAWIRAAEEDPFIRRLVTLAGAGGARGELVMSHIVLITGLLYVSGRSDFDPLGAYRSRYHRFRVVDRQPDNDGGPAATDDAWDGHTGPAASVG